MKLVLRLRIQDQVIHFEQAEESYSPSREMPGEAVYRFGEIGSSMKEIHDKTGPTAKALYKVLIDQATTLLGNCHPVPSPRKARILFGNLAWLLAKKVAVVKAELSQLPLEAELVELSLVGDLYESFRIPRTSLEAFAALRSANLELVLRYVLLAKRFGRKVTLSGQVASDALEANFTKRGVLRRGYLFFQRLLSHLSKRDRFLLEGTYLGRVAESLLSLSLGQLPSMKEERFSVVNQPAAFRDFRIDSTASYQEITKNIFRLLAPTGLQENYLVTLQNARKLGFASEPKVVFTSNSFYADDEFKANLVEVIDRSTYVVGQHGAGYGTSFWEEIVPEQEASDFFLSWGWEGPGVIPFGQIKPRLRLAKTNKLQRVTIFLRPDLNCFYSERFMWGLNDRYLASIVEFTKELGARGVKITLRFHRATSDATINHLVTQLEDVSDLKFDLQRTAVAKLVRRGNLCVFTYDSTGMLEFASSEIPFFGFIPDGLELVRPKFENNYGALRRAGMVSTNPDEAARLVSDWLTHPERDHLERAAALNDFSHGIVKYPHRKLPRIRSLLVNMTQGPEVGGKLDH